VEMTKEERKVKIEGYMKNPLCFYNEAMKLAGEDEDLLKIIKNAVEKENEENAKKDIKSLRFDKAMEDAEKYGIVPDTIIMMMESLFLRIPLLIESAGLTENDKADFYRKFSDLMFRQSHWI